MKENSSCEDQIFNDTNPVYESKNLFVNTLNVMNDIDNRFDFYKNVDDGGFLFSEKASIEVENQIQKHCSNDSLNDKFMLGETINEINNS